MEVEKAGIITFAKQFPSVLLGVYLILLVLVYPFLQANKNELILLSCLFLLIAYTVTCVVRKGISLNLKTTDLAVLCYSFYNVALIVFSERPVDPVCWFEWYGLILLYLITRGVTQTNVIIYAVIVSVCIQSLYGLGQQCGLFFSNNPQFSITGSFLNPGPLGGYLAVGFILSFILIFVRRRGWNRYVGVVLLVITGASILFSNSRAAWLSILIPSITYFISGIPRMKYRYSCGIFCVVMLVAASAGLSQYKKKSAEARIMIWEITLSSAGDHLLTGKGVSAFSAEYMYRQADYFEAHRNSDRTGIAANNTYVFNDFLRVLYEQGMIGLLLFSGMLLTAFSTRNSDNPSIPILKLGLLSLLIFSFFSYPSDILPLKQLFPVLLGSLSGRHLIAFSANNSLSRRIRCASLFLCVLFFGSTAFVVRQNTKVRKLMDDLYYESSESANEELKELYTCFRDNKELVLKYARVLFMDEAFADAIPVLERAAAISPSSLLLCDLGNAYAHVNRPCDAQRVFIKASYMTPAYVLPYYHLFLLYAGQNKTKGQIRVAKHIDRMVVKVENGTTRKVKQQIRHFLESIK